MPHLLSIWKRATPRPTLPILGVDENVSLHEQIAQRAHERWRQRGRTHGWDWADWFQAKWDIYEWHEKRLDTDYKFETRSAEAHRHSISSPQTHRLASWTGRKAGSRGRKPLLLVAFGVLQVRAVLYTLTSNTIALVAIQILDGVGAGIFGVVSVLVIADLTQGSGRFNVSLGAISTAVGIGASLSQVIAGLIKNAKMSQAAPFTLVLQQFNYVT